MPTSMIDGSLESAELKRSRGGVHIYKSLTLQPDNGPARTIRNAVVKQEIADMLKPGTRGRFYLYNAFDLKGVHGVRTAEGGSAYAFPGNNKKIFLMTIVIAIALIALRMATEGGVPLLGVLLIVFGGIGYFFMDKGEREAKAQFDGDAAHTP